MWTSGTCQSDMVVGYLVRDVQTCVDINSVLINSRIPRSKLVPISSACLMVRNERYLLHTRKDSQALNLTGEILAGETGMAMGGSVSIENWSISRYRDVFFKLLIIKSNRGHVRLPPSRCVRHATLTLTYAPDSVAPCANECRKIMSPAHIYIYIGMSMSMSDPMWADTHKYCLRRRYERAEVHSQQSLASEQYKSARYTEDHRDTHIQILTCVYITYGNLVIAIEILANIYEWSLAKIAGNRSPPLNDSINFSSLFI